MYEQDTPAYYGTFDFEDTVIGRDYRALVGVYAERNGGGGPPLRLHQRGDGQKMTDGTPYGADSPRW